MVKRYKASSLHPVDGVEDVITRMMDARAEVVLAYDYAALEAQCRDLQQYHDWAEPQVVTHGEDTLRIAELEAKLEDIKTLIGNDGPSVDELPYAIDQVIIRSAPETAVEPCRIHEYDGAFKCMAHQKTWGAITNGGTPCEGFDEKKFYADRDESRGDWDPKNERFTGNRSVKP